MGLVTDEVVAAQYQAEISRLTSEADYYARQYQALDSEARRVNTYRSGLTVQIRAANNEMIRLRQQAGQSRREWLALVDPFTKLSRGEYPGAIMDLTKWVVLELDNWVAYAYRGFACACAGEYGKAEADYASAVRLGGSVASQWIKRARRLSKARR